MSELRERMLKIMELRNLVGHSQRSYLAAVRGLAKHYKKSPDEISTEMIEDYLLYLKNTKGLAPKTVACTVGALKFFYRHVLSDNERVPKFVFKKPRKLPVVLTQEEIWRIINGVENMKHRLILMTTYSAGLRASEVAMLKPEDIDSKRMLIKVVNGKGGKQRYTLLSKRLLKELRQYYKEYHPENYLFPSAFKKREFLSYETMRSIYNAARKKAGVNKGPGLHTLRHSFATHLLEAGYDIRKIQVLMGHRHITTTTIYLQVSQKTISRIKSPLDLYEQECTEKGVKNETSR